MEYVIASICVVIIILGLVAYLIQVKVFAFFIDKSIFGKRMEKSEDLKYFGPEDYEGLVAKEHFFPSDKGQKLYGVLYYYPQDKYLGTVVLAHGMGGGHLAYMTEIAHFAQKGYRVFSYDMTGTQKSEGASIRGVEQAFIDLYYALEYIHTLINDPILLYGHSMGGYAVINVLRFDVPYVKGVVSLSSFNIWSDLLSRRLKQIFRKRAHKVLMRLEKKMEQRFGQFANIKSVDTLMKSTIPILLVHGRDDEVVFYDDSMQLYYDKLINKENITFVSIDEKRHRPNISAAAVKYASEVDQKVAELSMHKRNKDQLKAYYQSLDYNLLIQFDDGVMKVIDDFMEETIKSLS